MGLELALRHMCVNERALVVVPAPLCISGEGGAEQ